jgi:hypothetical protein
VIHTRNRRPHLCCISAITDTVSWFPSSPCSIKPLRAPIGNPKAPPTCPNLSALSILSTKLKVLTGVPPDAAVSGHLLDRGVVQELHRVSRSTHLAGIELWHSKPKESSRSLLPPFAGIRGDSRTSGHIRLRRATPQNQGESLHL